MLITDKAMIGLFYKYYLKAETLNANKFILKAEKLNKMLGINFNEADCKGFVSFFRLFKGMYRIFDLIDMRYDKKKACYRCEVEFVKDLEPGAPGHKKRGRKFFNPKLYWSHLFPKYDPGRKIILDTSLY